MDLSSPMSSLVPTLEGAVLEVLAGTEAPLGASQISRLSRRGARSGVHRVLDRLTGHGLVLAERTNMGFTYRLNRAHLLAEAVLSATHARQDFLQRLAEACKTLEPGVIAAALFGSTARRKSGPDSDIDLVLITPDVDLTDVWDDQIRDLESQVLAWTGNRLECLILSQSKLRTGVQEREPILDNLREESVTLVGPSMATLMLEGEEVVV